MTPQEYALREGSAVLVAGVAVAGLLVARHGSAAAARCVGLVAAWLVLIGVAWAAPTTRWLAGLFAVGLAVAAVAAVVRAAAAARTAARTSARGDGRGPRLRSGA